MENNFSDYEILTAQKIARQNEKAGIRRLAAGLGLAYCGVVGISLSWYYFAVIIAGIFGVSATKFNNIISDPAVSCFVQIILSVLFFIVPFSLFLNVGEYDLKEVLPFKRPKKELTLPLILMGVGAASFSNIANSISGDILIYFGFPDKYSSHQFPQGFFGFLLTVISTAVIPAFVEEFGMRGACLGTLRRFGDGFAIFVSSLLFGLIHGNFSQIFFAAIIGLAAGYATVKSGSILPAIVIHFVNNFISVMVDYGSTWFGAEAAGVIYMFVLCFNLVLGVIGIIMLFKNKEQSAEVEENKTVSSFKEKMIWFFTSPVIIIGIALSLYEAIFLR